MFGMDISKWQKGIDINGLPSHIEFIIMKLTQGKSLVDSQAAKHLDAIIRRNSCLGIYHYATPTKCSVSDEAHHFVNTVRTLINDQYRFIPFIDWEDGEGVYLVDWLYQWIEIVEQELSQTVGVYMNSSVYTELSMRDRHFEERLKNNLLWLAHWGTNKEHDINVPTILTSDPHIESDVWQYTSKGNYKGQFVDLDYTDMTDYEWMTSALPSHESYTDELEEAERFCIESGIMTYISDIPLTRRETAVVIRRLYNYIVQSTELKK